MAAKRAFCAFQRLTLTKRSAIMFVALGWPVVLSLPVSSLLLSFVFLTLLANRLTHHGLHHPACAA